MQTSDHPQDSIPAFVLGTLDIDEALLVSAHVQVCPDCRAEAEAFQGVLSALPYVAAPRQPPAYVKQQLLARIAVAAPTERRPTSSRALSRATPRWMQAATGGRLHPARWRLGRCSARCGSALSRGRGSNPRE